MKTFRGSVKEKSQVFSHSDLITVILMIYLKTGKGEQLLQALQKIIFFEENKRLVENGIMNYKKIHAGILATLRDSQYSCQFFLLSGKSIFHSKFNFFESE